LRIEQFLLQQGINEWFQFGKRRGIQWLTEVGGQWRKECHVYPFQLHPCYKLAGKYRQGTAGDISPKKFLQWSARDKYKAKLTK